MSDRDELATIIEDALTLSRGIIAWTGAAQDDIAAAILADGYRRPRTIATVEELDALPNGSVILDADRATATRLDADYWEVAGYASHFRIDAITLPVTVLYEALP